MCNAMLRMTQTSGIMNQALLLSILLLNHGAFGLQNMKSFVVTSSVTGNTYTTSRLYMAESEKSKVVWNEGKEGVPNWRQAPPAGVQWNQEAIAMPEDYDGNFLSRKSQDYQDRIEDGIATREEKESSSKSKIQWNSNLNFKKSSSPTSEVETSSLNPYDSKSRIQWNVNPTQLHKTAQDKDEGGIANGVEEQAPTITRDTVFDELLSSCSQATSESVAAFGKGGGATGSSEWHGFRTEQSFLEQVEEALGKMVLRSMEEDGSALAWAWLLASPSPIRVTLETNSRFAVYLTVVPSGKNRCPPHSPQSGSLLLTRLLRGQIDQVKHIVGSDGSYREVSTVQHPKFQGEQVWKTFAGSSRQMVNSQGNLLGDEGIAVFLDVIMFPPGKEVFGYDTGALTPDVSSTYPENDGIVVMATPPCDPTLLFTDINSTDSLSGQILSLQSHKAQSGLSLSSTTRKHGQGPEKNEPVTSKEWIKDLVTDVGGLEKELQDITRRVLASRTLPADVRDLMGIRHVRGLLLYGPPGCGKTLIARELAKRLNARPPKMVSGPELLDKWVGEAERNVRRLFIGAEEELERCVAAGGNPLDLPLHVICFDEIDALCKKRGALTGDTSGVRDSVVNQLLSKIDGLKSLDNILVVGMTNRMELIDEAMLRPGRLEVIMRIPEPDQEGRKQILGIHLKNAYETGKISEDVDIDYLVKKTEGYSGAHLVGLVRSGTSFAIERWQEKDQSNDLKGDKLKITMEDFQRALLESGPSVALKSKRKRLKRNIKNLRQKVKARLFLL